MLAGSLTLYFMNVNGSALVRSGANLIQGYYFSRPLREEAFVDYKDKMNGR